MKPNIETVFMFVQLMLVFFCPQFLMAVWGLFLPMASRCMGGQQEIKSCPGCVLETVTCRMLIPVRDIG